MSGGTYNLKSTPNDRFIEKLFMAILFPPRIFVRNLLRGSRRRNIFIFSFWCLSWDLNSDLTSNKPTHYLLYYRDFSDTMAEPNFHQDTCLCKVNTSRGKTPQVSQCRFKMKYKKGMYCGMNYKYWQWHNGPTNQPIWRDIKIF